VLLLICVKTSIKMCVILIIVRTVVLKHAAVLTRAYVPRQIQQSYYYPSHLSSAWEKFGLKFSNKMSCRPTQDVRQSNKRTKATSQARTIHHSKEGCRKQRQLAEEFVINLPPQAKDQREHNICVLKNVSKGK